MSRPSSPRTKRAVADQVLQSEHVVAERRAIVQIDVEGHEIEEREIEILRGGVTGVGDQAVGIGLLDHVPQLREESLDAPRAVPADDIGRNFVADVISQDAGMKSTAFSRAADAPAGIGLGSATLEEADVRGPGDVHEDGHPALIDQIEQPLAAGHDRCGSSWPRAPASSPDHRRRTSA